MIFFGLTKRGKSATKMTKSCLFVTLLIFATTCNMSLAKCIPNSDPYWKRFGADTSILPSDAIIGGYESETLYIIRSEYEGSLMPGKFIPSQHKAFVPWNHKAHLKHEYEILCGRNYKWVPTIEGNIPARAVVGGKSENDRNETLYVCRAQHSGYHIPGKVHPSQKTCYIAYDNREIEKKSYEILVAPVKIAECIPNSDPYWKRFDADTSILPSDAILGGYENETLYIIRSEYGGSLMPGKFIPSQHKAFVPWNYKAQLKNEYEILCGHDYKWVHTTGGNIPARAVVGGYSENEERETLYVCRAHYKGYSIPGKVQPSHKSCFIPYGDEEIVVKSYEILVIFKGIPPSIISSYPIIFKSFGGRDKQLKIPCETTGSPKPIITWKLKDINISPSTKYSIINGALIINKPQLNDSQKYECIAENEFGSAHATFQAKIQILPNITSSSSVISKMVQGRSTQLKIPCEATGYPKPIITWKLKNVKISQNSKYAIINGALIINEPQVKDSQIYECVAENDAGYTNAMFQAEIQIPPSIISNSSVIFKSVEGRDTQLKIPCEATGYPKPIITWKSKYDINPSLKYSIIDGALIINVPQVSDSQKYKCIAENEAGSAHATFQADIQLPPRIISRPSVTFKSVEGRDTQLKIPCVAMGSPKPIITWKLKDVNITPNSKYSIVDGALIINKPQVSDNQEYKCEAKNDAGSTYAVFQTDIQLSDIAWRKIFKSLFNLP